MTKLKPFAPSLRPRLGWLAQYLGRWLPAKRTVLSATSVSYTYLFRDVDDYVDKLVSYHSEHNRPIDILSVGCATGQEVYSIAAICQEFGIPFQITGIDISARAIAIAESGIYDWSSEIDKAKNNADTPEVMDRTLYWLHRCDRYFESIEPANVDHSTGNTRQAIGDIRERVKFSVADIGTFRSDKKYDFVVCRKMIYYLPSATRVSALNLLAASTKDSNLDRLILDPYSLGQPFVMEWLSSMGEPT